MVERTVGRRAGDRCGHERARTGIGDGGGPSGLAVHVGGAEVDVHALDRLAVLGEELGRRVGRVGGDRQLADRAWQVLNIRQGMENFVPVPGADEVNAGIYSTYPNRTIDTRSKPSNLKYDPTDK